MSEGRSAWSPGDGLQRFTDHLHELSEPGIDQAIVSDSRPWDRDGLAAVAGVVREVDR